MAPFVTGVAARRSSDTAPGGAFHVLPGRSLCRAAFGQLGLFRNLFLQVSAQAFRCVCREWVINVGLREAFSRLAHMSCELIYRLRSAGRIEGHVAEIPSGMKAAKNC
ncbi:hypothetical protein X739_28240 [Mesorhizobium sp. LNHC220B00]|nr:hypothetical protein [Mesorhizobium sp. LNHC220B00]ESY81099.1 hypothetical protein X739_28240 [Mesorhizobium sp. LNHC220B00]